MVHILQRPTFVAAIQEEISPTMSKIQTTHKEDQNPLAKVIIEKLVERCPQLNSAFNEILCICSNGCSIREAKKSVRVGGKDIPVGSKVVLPQRQLLMSREGFAPHTQELDLSSFVKDKNLGQSSYHHPYVSDVTLYN